MTDEHTPPVEHNDAGEDENGAEAAPPVPSTYAGRARRTEPSGVTDELEALNQEISEEADDGLEDLPRAEPVRDEPVAEEPADPEWAEVEDSGSDDDAAGGEGPDEPAIPAAPATGPRAGETMETDTVILADQEAAQEAALEGVRARAAAHTPPSPTPPVAMPPPATAAGALAASPSAPAPVAAAPPAPRAPAAPPARPIAAEVGEAPKGRIWLRFLVGAILIIVSMATATAVSGLVRVQDLVNGIKGIKVGKLLSPTGSSDPRTILILGSDKRPGEGDRGRSDTTILLRVDDNHINLMSIPRDLKTSIPGHGTDKFNAAYSYGGPHLTTKTVEGLTGLDINTVVNINFTGFADAVNEIGCVYVDVDHHYYHSNVGLDTASQYSEIDIPAGYQRMCGFNALAYVRYRHEDNDLVRSARQQAFLREARAQVPVSRFVNDYYGLTDIFKKYTSSSVQNAGELIGLANLFLNARNAPIKEIHFPGDVGDATSTYVTASRSAIKKTVAEFLGETETTAPPPSGTGTEPAKKKPRKAKPESNLTPQSSNELVDASSSGAEAASGATQTPNGRSTGVPVYFPTKLPPNALFDDVAYNGDDGNTRGLVIDGGGGRAYYGYKIVAQLQYGYTAYFGFSGTNWKDAPILDNPTEEREVDGRDYLLYFDNGRLRQVAFRTDDAAYWVENDLLETLTPDQMMGMAESMTKYVP